MFETQGVPRPPPPRATPAPERPVLSPDGRVLPTPAAKAAAAAMPEQTDGPLCIFCRSNMNSNEDCEALWCGHAFHRVCLVEWRICAGKGPQDCPMRCQSLGCYFIHVFWGGLSLFKVFATHLLIHLVFVCVMRWTTLSKPDSLATGL